MVFNMLLYSAFNVMQDFLLSMPHQQDLEKSSLASLRVLLLSSTGVRLLVIKVDEYHLQMTEKCSRVLISIFNFAGIGVEPSV
jgi:hypothetical protein